MALQKSLAEQLPLDSRTELYPWLKRLLAIIEPRFGTLEAERITIDGTLDLIRDTALARINTVITPLALEASERLREISDVFSTTSTTANTLSMADKVFFIADGTRSTFASLGYVVITRKDDPTSGLTGRVADYSVETGALSVQVAAWWGNPVQHNDWVISATLPFEAQAKLAAQINAYTKDEVDALIGDTIQQFQAVMVGAPADRRTFKALSDLIDSNATAIVLANQNIAATAAIVQAGVPSLDAFRALANYVAMRSLGSIDLVDGFVQPFNDNSGIDPSSSGGFFVDVTAGQLVGGTGAQTFVLENASSLPKMTSNTQTATGVSGYVASASSARNGSATENAWGAFDGAPNSGWTSPANPGLPQWIMLKGPAAILVAGYAIIGNNANSNYGPTAFQLQGTNDPTAATNAAGANWNILDSRTGVALGGSRNVFTVASANQNAYLYHRLVITAGGNASDNNIITVFELELLQYTPCFETYPSIPAMTSANTTAGSLPGYLVTASSQTTYPAWNALSQLPLPSTSTNPKAWDTDNGTTGQWIQLQTPNPIKLGGYAIGMYNDGTNYCYPDDFQLLASNTGNAGDWNILDTRFSVSSSFLVTSGFQRVVLNIPPAVQAAYKYHRLVVNKVRTNLSATRVILPVWDLLQVITGIENQTSIPAMTGQNAPVGQQALSSANNDATLPGWKAWDNKRAFSTAAANGGTSWEGAIWHGPQSAPGWVTRSLSAAITVLAYRLAGLGWGYANNIWQLQGTNDDTALSNPANATWNILDSRSVGTYSWLPNIGDVHTFKVQNPGSYKHYRMYFPVAGQDGYCRVNECELLQGTSGNMDLKLVPYTRKRGMPTKASIVVDIRPRGTFTLNTTVKAQVSRNGVAGTFKDVPLTLLGPLANGVNRYQSDPVDLSSLPQANQIVPRLLFSGGAGGDLQEMACYGTA